MIIRTIAKRLTENTKQPMLIDNRPGGSGAVGVNAMKQGNPDGYTVFLGHSGTHAINQSLIPNLSYDPVKDFEPVTVLWSFGHIAMVPANSPARTLSELVVLAKTKPGGLSYGSQGIGTGAHLMGEVFKKVAGTPMTHVPYKGSAQIIPDILSGTLDLVFFNFVSASSYVKDGKLRMLAMATAKRAKAFPDLPTFAELGFPGVEMDYWFGILAPARTPGAIVTRLHDEFTKAARVPEFVREMADQDIQVPLSAPAEFRALIAADTAKLGKIVRDAGASAE